MSIRILGAAGLVAILAAGCAWLTTDHVSEDPAMQQASMHSVPFERLDGGKASFAEYSGKVVLVVNVASECGYTPQYAGLEALHRDLGARGLVVLGFPSNEFGGQEPGDAAAIQSFCTTNYGVTFPLGAKLETKAGSGQSPVYSHLGAATGKLPGWNFCKYLVGRDGKVIGFFSSNVAPDAPELRAAIDAALATS